MKYTIQSLSGTRQVEFTSTPCTGDASQVFYRMLVDGQNMQVGVCKPAEFGKIVRKWAKRMLIDVTSVKSV